MRLTTLPPSCAVVMKSGNLNFLEPSGPLQACTGIALPFYGSYCTGDKGGRYVRLTTLPPSCDVMKSGNLNVLEPSGPLQACNGIALPFYGSYCTRGKGGRYVRLTTLPPSCDVVMKSGNLNFLEPSGPLQACNGIALPFNFMWFVLNVEDFFCYLTTSKI